MNNRKIIFTTILCTLACVGLLSSKAFGVNPPPDGCYPGFTTAEGCNALQLLTTGTANTAHGWYSLFSDSTGSYNTGIGGGALVLNNGDQNTAVGAAALLLNTVGIGNTALGMQALESNDNGNGNTATGALALFSNTTGVGNTASGAEALFVNTSGNLNTALGNSAGFLATTGSNNVYIGSDVLGVAGESFNTYISNVYGSVATARAVYVNSDNKIGTLSSSRRYKEEIRPMNQASNAIFALKPVSFRYKKEIDRSRALCFGLIAEEVAQISPELITRDRKGKPQTVRYEAVNAMLLNEFLKEHKKVEEQEATIAQLKKKMQTVVAQLKEQAAQIEKVSAQVELNTARPRVVRLP